MLQYKNMLNRLSFLHAKYNLEFFFLSFVMKLNPNMFLSDLPKGGQIF